MYDTASHGVRQTTASYYFVFLANALALDLINTDVILRRKRRDLLPTLEAVAQWWEAMRSHHPEIASPADERWRCPELFEAIKRLRSALRTLFDAVVAGQPVSAAELAPLNEILRLGYQELGVTPEGDVQPGYGIHGDAVEALLLPIALSAFDLLARADRERLRHCENPHCVALFYDTSKSATRRWCSEGCMNRARSAERYARVKDERART